MSRALISLLASHAYTYLALNGKMLYLRFLLNVLLPVLAAVWLYSNAVRALGEAYRKGHDAATVARMLARIGEATAHYENCDQWQCEVDL